MISTLVVMLIWVGGGGSNSGAAVISGFSSVAACERAMPRVHKFYDGFLLSAKIECVELE